MARGSVLRIAHGKAERIAACDESIFAKAMMTAPQQTASEGEDRRMRGIAGTEAALAAVLLVVLLGSAQLQTSWRSERAGHASDAATILALAGVRAFTDHGNARALMEIPVGADSMVMKARVFVGDESMGSYAVRVAHVGPAAFRVRSTGRLVERGRSMMCSLDVFVQLAQNESERPSMGVQQEPLCNGSRHRSAVTSVRNIGS